MRRALERYLTNFTGGIDLGDYSLNLHGRSEAVGVTRLFTDLEGFLVDGEGLVSACEFNSVHK